MEENLAVESQIRLPPQVVRARAAADAAAKADRDRRAASDSERPDPTAITSEDAAQVPPLERFSIEELFKAPSPEKDASRDYWYARANAEGGFRRTEKVEHARQLQALQSRIKELEAKNLELVKAQSEAPPAAASTPAPAIDLKELGFTEEQLAAMGEENITSIMTAAVKAGETRAKAYVQQALKPFLEAQKKRDEDAATAAEQTRTLQEEAFVEALTEGFPTWETVDKDTRWRKWLAGIDRASGLQRQRLVNLHKGDLNAAGLIALLEEFQRSLGPAPTAPEPPITPGELPDGGTGGPAPGVNRFKGKLLSAEVIRQGYKLRSLNKMSDQDFKDFEAQIKAQETAAGTVR